MHRRDQLTGIITLNLKMVWVIGSFLGTVIGGRNSNTIEGLGVKSHKKLEWQVNICVTHRVLYPSSNGGDTWILASEIISNMGYAKILFLYEEQFRLWDYPGYQTMRMNKYQLHYLW